MDTSMTPSAPAPKSSAPRPPSRPVDDVPRIARWVLGGMWVSLPFVAGPSLAAGLAARTDALQHVTSIGLWGAWAAGIVCVLVPRTMSLTAIRVLTPGAPAAVLVLVLSSPYGSADAMAVAAGLALAVAIFGLSLTPWIGHAFVNGSSYGDERRFVLRPPAALLLGPIEIAWLALVATPVAGVLLAASDRWLGGLALVVLSGPFGFVIVRALHGLSRRWLVLVPAGIVIHDYAALTDSVLVQRRLVRAILSAAECESTVSTADATAALDLTGGTLGPRIRIRFTEAIAVVPRPRARPGSGVVAASVETTAVTMAPTRARTLLATTSFGA